MSSIHVVVLEINKLSAFGEEATDVAFDRARGAQHRSLGHGIIHTRADDAALPIALDDRVKTGRRRRGARANQRLPSLVALGQ